MFVTSLIVWSLGWFAPWSIIIRSGRGLERYDVHPRLVVSFFVACSLLWLFFLDFQTWWYWMRILLGSALVWVPLGMLTWKWWRRQIYIIPQKQVSSWQLWQNLEPSYLIGKGFDVLWQQLGLATLWLIVSQHSSSQSLAIFVIIFFSVHLPAILASREPGGALYVYASFFGALIFGFIFQNFGLDALWLSYSIHMLFYITLGILGVGILRED